VPHTLQAAALRYAANGVPVFLLGRTKRPLANCPDCHNPPADHDPQACKCLTCHGFYAATTDADRIGAMFAAHPAGLLAIRTGATSGLVVLDVDPHNGGDVSLVQLLAEGLAPATRHVRTGSGGLHLYYRYPGVEVPSSQSRMRQGVDVRGDGGYAVAPPSRHPRTGRPYRWAEPLRPITEMPPPLVAACQPKPQNLPPSTTPAQPQTGRLPARGGISAPDRLLAAHLDAVRNASAGRRRVTLYGAARGVARMVAAGAIARADAWAALTDAGRSAQQTERDIRKAISGGFLAEGVTP
jgi:hypothetical protein